MEKVNNDLGFGEPLNSSMVLGEEAENMYYGVHIPPDVQAQESDESVNVFQKKDEALQVVKKYKKARFKAFVYYYEAAEFAVHGCENPNNNSSIDAMFPPKVGQETVQTVGEKPSQFRGPTAQNLVKLRKEIEAGNLEVVEKTIWDNPRYLIGVGDTPSILQEGFRYNGLHVAAKSKNAHMCELILNTISDVTFVKKLYADDRNPEERAKILLDLYLNTPDKGLHETPLHFAVKFGAANCVEVLVSFPQCDRNLRNKHGHLPSQIICSRYDGPDAVVLIYRMSRLLQENYYVPVLRSEDNCAPPVIGEPFSPTFPPNFNQNPLSPRMEIHAYAGPMNKEGAEKFRKLWKTPPRTRTIKNHSTPLEAVAMLKLKDHEKGLERLGNNLAHEMKVGWREYWPFLDSFTDIATTEGLEQLESYLEHRSSMVYNTLPHSMQSSPQDKSGMHSPPKNEDHDSVMMELCNKLQACSLKISINSLSPVNDNHSDVSPHLCIDKSLQVFAKRISKDIVNLLDAECDKGTLFEAQVKQFQLLMASYKDDNRFLSVDFHLVHSRLAYLVMSFLKNTQQDFKLLDIILDQEQDYFGKNYDCFSSDDEGVTGTVIPLKNQHAMCILKNLREYISTDITMDDVMCEEDCIKVWRQLKPCTCIWRSKNGKKGFSGKKISNKLRRDISRKLSYDEDLNDSCNGKTNFIKSRPVTNGIDDSCSSSSDDEYFTPPSSPSLMEQSDEENDVFEETNLPDTEVYIEGDFPTKVDCAVFNTLNYADCKLKPNEYPYIYRWHHSVSQFSEAERTGWCNPRASKWNLSMPQMMWSPIRLKSAKTSNSPPPSYTPTKSWLRVTGANSPRASLMGHGGNVSFNL